MSLTTDRNNEGLNKAKADGQNEAYLILSEEERAKGFVRPVRKSYTHVGVKLPPGKIRDLTEQEKGQWSKFGYIKYYVFDNPSDGAGYLFTEETLKTFKNGIIGGCGTSTRMGQAISETYARDPSFYGATFCCGCGKHLPVGEFVWDGTTEKVGS